MLQSVAGVSDIPEEFIKHFASGFPSDWKKVVHTVRQYVKLILCRCVVLTDLC